MDKLHNAGVAAYYGKIVQYYIVTSDCYITIATVLDPRLKLASMMSKNLTWMMTKI